MVILLILTLVLGASMGSFATVVVERMRNNRKGIMWGRSECPQCHKKLRKTDLIPVLSYLALGRKCRSCERKIPSFYLIMELCGAALYWLLFLHFGLTLETVFWFVITPFFLIMALYDARYQELPVVILFSLLISVLGLEIFAMYPLSLGDGLLGAAIPFTLFGLQYYLSDGRWIGDGDIYLGVLMGLLLGWQMVIVALFLSYVIASSIALMMLGLRKLDHRGFIAFAPFLIAGMFLTVLFGEQMLGWYLKMAAF